LALLASLLGAATPARADAPPRPRAVVAVTIADGVDSFMPVYVLELGAAVLREAGFDVVPPNAASLRLRAIHRDAAQCSQATACPIELASALGAPTLVLAHLSRDGQTYSLHATALLVADGAIEQVSHVEVSGDEGEIARRVREVVAALAQRPSPCVARFDVGAGARVTVSVDGQVMQPLAHLLFLRGGTRQLQLAASGRARWQGALRCEPAHAYRVTVR